MHHINSAMNGGRGAGLVYAALCAVSAIALAEGLDGIPVAERAERLVETKRILDAMRLTVTPDRKGTPVKRSNEPVLRYTDSTRLTSDSTLWIYGAARAPRQRSSRSNTI